MHSSKPIELYRAKSEPQCIQFFKKPLRGRGVTGRNKTVTRASTVSQRYKITSLKGNGGGKGADLSKFRNGGACKTKGKRNCL